MKGIVFTEFFELVEEAFGFEMVDTIIDESLPSGGVYTAIDTYDHSEIVHLVVRLSKESKVPVDDLLVVFGKHLFKTFSTKYQGFFANAKTAFDMLASVEEYIHVEVRKLYPDAQLPAFDITRHNEKELEMIYHSERSMGMLAYGLIEGCLSHFGESADIEMTPLTEDGSNVRFNIVKNAG